METIEAILEAFVANPWQPREAEDPEHIKELALSIAQDGLMQLPVGRWVSEKGLIVLGNPAGDLTKQGCKIQLAFGHSRLAAFKWLEEVKGNSNLDGDWSLMPVIIRELSDEEMFRMAISENLQRKDLNPIEEAKAMRRYRDDFSRTSAEIGALFGLSDAAVRNKMRLLELPEDIQQAAIEGKISEGAARELLRYYALPAELQKAGEHTWNRFTGNQVPFMEMALGGATAESIHQQINQIISQNSVCLARSKWELDQHFDLALEGNQNLTCRGCPWLVKLNDHFCMQKTCYQARERMVIQKKLAEAAARTGLKPAEDLARRPYEYVGLNKGELAEIRQSGCEHLVLVYEDNPSWSRTDSIVPGTKDVVMLCDRKNGQCTCANGIAARKKLAAAGLEVIKEQPKDGKPAVIATPAEKAGVQAYAPASAEQLADLARQKRRARKQIIEEIKAMQEDFAKRLMNAFVGRNPRVMAELLLGFVYSTERYKYQTSSADEILYKAALHFAESEYNWEQVSKVDMGEALKRYNAFLREAKLDEIIFGGMGEPEYVPVEETEAVPMPRGKPLVEVFEAEEGGDAE